MKTGIIITGGRLTEQKQSTQMDLQGTFERWLEDEKELLLEIQEEVANQNPSKDSQAYWESKNNYDMQRLKVDTILASLNMVHKVNWGNKKTP